MQLNYRSISANGTTAAIDSTNDASVSHAELQVERPGTVTAATVSVQARAHPALPFRELYQVTAAGDIRQVPSYPQYQFVVTGYTGSGAIQFAVSA